MDATYRRLFSRPRMVRDLLRGFAARGWSGGIDFGSLTRLPASYVSRDLRCWRTSAIRTGSRRSGT